MYYYILGCGIACLVLFGINSMDTVDGQAGRDPG